MRVPVVYMRQVALSGAGGFADELRGASELGDPEYQVQVRRLWPFGIRSVPPAGVDAVAVGTSMSGLAMVGAESSRYGPSDLADGETALYCSGAAEVRLSGAAVTVNGGAKSVARVDDLVVANTTMATWIADVTSALATLGQTVTAPTDFGKISTGATNFKG